jgi:hypothetical protein
MIKFVCTSCGERLSVPDQHAGRKGICPNCHAVNRIPQKAGAESAGHQVAAPQPVEQVAAGATSAGIATSAAKPASSARAQSAGTEVRARESSRPAMESPAGQSKAPPTRPVETPTAPAKTMSPREDRASRPTPPTIASTPEFDDSPAEMVELHKERRLPRKVKIALLILAALALVGGLYFALLFALHAMIPGDK